MHQVAPQQNKMRERLHKRILSGGIHAFADPERGISFAYVMNQMEQSLLPNEKSLRLVDALYEQLQLLPLS